MQPDRPRLARPSALLLTGAVAFGLVVAAQTPAFAAPTVVSASITAPSEATVGDTVDASIALAGTTDVYAYELVIGYDPAVLDYVDGSATAPEGGFDAVQDAEGSLTITHTRLGSSPSLAGDITVGLSFAAVGAGTGDLDLDSVTLVGADGTTLVLTDPSSAPLTVAAAPTPSPSAPLPTPTDPAPTDPAPTSPGGGTVPADTPDRDGTGPLAMTGADAVPLIAIGAAAVLAGLIALTVALRRRRVGAAR